MEASTPGIGNRLAPVRFIAFLAMLVAASPVAMHWLGWRQGLMAGFDAAAALFLVSCLPLLDDEADVMRDRARRNDANRIVLLGITGIVTIVILAAVAAELSQKGAPKPLEILLVVATLMLAWLFSNGIYALHYAHLYYLRTEAGADQGGLAIPKTDEPDYWDFLYFAFTLGMTFQTSDVEIEGRAIRRVALFHCLAAFVFNLGVVAFTINVLGGG